MFLWQPAACSTNELVAMATGIGCASERLNNRGRKKFHTYLWHCMDTHVQEDGGKKSTGSDIHHRIQPRANRSGSSRSEDGISFQHYRRLSQFHCSRNSAAVPKFRLSSLKLACFLARGQCSDSDEIFRQYHSSTQAVQPTVMCRIRKPNNSPFITVPE